MHFLCFCYQEADAVLDMERRAFYSASMDYVLMLQKVQEKKKFEFVETLLRFMYAWLTFYHQVGAAGSCVSLIGNMIRRLSEFQYSVFLTTISGPRGRPGFQALHVRPPTSTPADERQLQHQF